MIGRVLGAVAVTGANDAVGQVAGVSVWVNVDQLAGEIGVGRCVAAQSWSYRPGHFCVHLERLGREDKHVHPRFHVALVERAGAQFDG